MKIVGLLSWYDESPAWLAAAVSGFARVCDEIVAVDGAYGLYPGARERSHPDQAEAVVLTCEAMNVGCTLHRPRAPFFDGNEVQKRNLTLGLAAPLEPDWVLVFDADMHVIRCDVEIVRAELERTDLDVATVTLLDGKDLLGDEKTATLARDIDFDTEWTMRARHVYRWTDDLAYGPAHYTVSGTYGGEKRWLRGPEMTVGGREIVVEAVDLRSALVAVHRSQHRAKVRRDAALVYYRVRDAAGVENVDETVFS